MIEEKNKGIIEIQRDRDREEDRDLKICEIIRFVMIISSETGA